MILPKFGDLLLILEKPGEFITHRKKKLEFLGKNQPLRFTRKFKKSVKLPTLSMSRRGLCDTLFYLIKNHNSQSNVGGEGQAQILLRRAVFYDLDSIEVCQFSTKNLIGKKGKAIGTNICYVLNFQSNKGS